MSHKLKIDDNYVEHIFALVVWFDEHPHQFYFGKPLKVWKTNFISDGPLTFLPVNKIISRCLYALFMNVHVITKHYLFNSKNNSVIYSCLTGSLLKYTNMILPIAGHLPVVVIWTVNYLNYHLLVRQMCYQLLTINTSKPHMPLYSIFASTAQLCHVCY